ncbi:MAG: ATP synthase F1 subunit gamma [Clostridiales bacterium]|nr:ATP synthase F1 subunit gamma [Clostridiales bacterium]
MASSSMKDIKKRIGSIKGTRQITKAMELVSSSKLLKARQQIANSREYHLAISNEMAKILSRNIDTQSPYFNGRPKIRKSCYVVIAGDRGLAGGYNNNVFRYLQDEIGDKDRESVCIIPIGRKATEYYSNRNFEIVTKEFFRVDEIDVGSCHEIAGLITNLYCKEEFDEVFIVFTHFVSLLSQQPAMVKILPLDESIKRDTGEKSTEYLLIEPGSDVVFNALVPSFIAGMLWGSVNESLTSEHAARRVAMESASKNAEEIIEDLSRQYNRARQGSITQELTEIIAGSGM